MKAPDGEGSSKKKGGGIGSVELNMETTPFIQLLRLVVVQNDNQKMDVSSSSCFYEDAHAFLAQMEARCQYAVNPL